MVANWSIWTIPPGDLSSRPYFERTRIHFIFVIREVTSLWRWIKAGGVFTTLRGIHSERVEWMSDSRRELPWRVPRALKSALRPIISPRTHPTCG